MSEAGTVIVVGAGGHAKVLLDALAAAGTRVAGLTDADPAKHGTRILGVSVLGPDAVLERHPPASTVLVNGIGSTESLTLRRSIFERGKAQGYRFLSVVHPSAVVAADAALGEGVQLMAGSIVQAGATIGEDTILNTGAQVDHDCVLGRSVHLGPRVALSGAVTVGDGSHLGTGACVIQGVRIGRGCLVAAGAVVVRDLEDGARVAGVPAREMPA